MGRLDRKLTPNRGREYTKTLQTAPGELVSGILERGWNGARLEPAGFLSCVNSFSLYLTVGGD